MAGSAGFGTYALESDTFESTIERKLELLHSDFLYKSWWETLAPYSAEFCGTFLLTLTYLCNASAGDATWAVTSNAVMMMVVMYAFGHISGGNLNPAISLAVWLARRQAFRTTCQFCFVQILGAAFAALVFYRFAHIEVNLGPKPGYGWWEVMMVELIYTSMICFVYLNCAASRGNNPLGSPNGFMGLAVGLTYIAGGYASLQISGTVMNPAVAVGLSLVDKHPWGLKYLPMEIIGCFVAVSGYRLVRPKEMDASLMLEPQDPLWQATLGGKVMAEFIGTFFLILTKALNNIAPSKAEAWSVGAALASMQYSLRGVSGGHFNPAVSLSTVLTSRRMCTKKNAVVYVFAQVLGGLAASTVYGIVNHGGEILVRPPKEFEGRAGAIVLGEVIFTCLTSYTVMTTSVLTPVATKNRANDVAGLAVGMCVAVGGFAVGNISGAVLNPAMALGFTGLNVIGGNMFQSAVMAYIFYEVGGAILASCLFCLTHPHYFKTDATSGVLLYSAQASPAGSST